MAAGARLTVPHDKVSKLPLAALSFSRFTRRRTDNKPSEESLGVVEKAKTVVSTDISSVKPKQSCVSFVKSWRMPFTLDAWRWGLQEALTISLLMWPSCVPAVDQFLFKGNCRWVVASATPVIEGTAGGTTRRMIDRTLGTITAGILVIIACTITIGVNSERTDRWYCLFALYLIVSCCGFFYNWLLFRFPSHPLIGVTAAFMTPVIVGGSVFTGAAVYYALWRSITVTAGVIVSGLITRYFLPRRARVDIINGLATIIDELAAALEPLVELESGMVSSASFFEGGKEPHGVFGLQPNESTNSAHSNSETEGRVEVDMAAWKKFKDTIWQRLETCGKLTNDQLVMVNAARTEVSLRPKNAFYQAEHTEALVNIRTLFYHVTSLFFLIDTQIGGVTDFEDDNLLEEVEHWSKFGVLEIETARHLPTLNEHEEIMLDNPGGGCVPVSIHTPQLNDAERWKADVCPTMRWAQLYGPTVGSMVRHICSALRAVAEGLRDTEFPLMSEIAIKRAANAIALFHSQRAERQQATATFVEYAIHGRASSNMPHDDPDFLANFERILGLSVSDYESLSLAGRAAFWDSYWLLRDRLSTTDTTVMTLFVAVRTAIASVEKLIDARIQKLNRGENLNDQVDIDKVEVEKSAAVQKAGGVAQGMLQRPVDQMILTK